MVDYGKKCIDDGECSSGICEMTYDKLNNPKGRYCVTQSKKYGKVCELNSDCISNRCELTYDKYGVPGKKRCVIIKGLKKQASESMFKEEKDLPESMKADDRTKRIEKEQVILNPHQKALAFSGRGPIAGFVCTILELLLSVVLKIFWLFVDIWKMIVKMIWNILFGTFGGLLGGLTPANCRTCYDSSVFRYIITILFPPAGVFMAKGVSGLMYFLICCFLTLMLYFPGLIYALIIMRGSQTNRCR